MDVAREAPEVQEMLSGKEEMQIGSRQSPQTRACGRNTASYIFILHHIYLGRRFWNPPQIDPGKAHSFQKVACIWQSSQDLPVADTEGRRSRCEQHRLCRQTVWDWIPALPPTNSGTLSKSLNVSMPHFSPLWNKDDNHTSMIKLLLGFNVFI